MFCSGCSSSSSGSPSSSSGSAVIFDLFGDHTLSGCAKAGGPSALIFLPWLGALIYLIARGKSMGERQMAAMADAQAQQEKYIQNVAAKTKTPAEQIADAKGLLDSGAITPGGVRRPEGQGSRLLISTSFNGPGRTCPGPLCVPRGASIADAPTIPTTPPLHVST